VNPDETWLTRLLAVSHAVSNEIFLPAKKKLGLSVPLMGTGMCFCRDIVLKYGWDAFSVGEDWEFYAKLITEGELVDFAKHARVYQQESSTLKQATSQRMRWASGRFAIAWKYGFGLFYRGLVERNMVKLEASFPLLFPNPSLGLNITIIGWMLSLYLWKITNSAIFFTAFSVLAFIQLMFFLIGMLYTPNKLKNFVSLFIAPVFLAWKMIIDFASLMGVGREHWVRTERKP
jgi:cellulose synthase/poly-beta-1,6-N-acetylglucosamine synthase-like glycosyltransferase